MASSDEPSFKRARQSSDEGEEQPPKTLAELLGRAGLSTWAATLEEEKIDSIELLTELTDQDMQFLGLKLGERLRLRQQLTAWKQPRRTPTPTAPQQTATPPLQQQQQQQLVSMVSSPAMSPGSLVVSPLQFSPTPMSQAPPPHQQGLCLSPPQLPQQPPGHQEQQQQEQQPVMGVDAVVLGPFGTPRWTWLDGPFVLVDPEEVFKALAVVQTKVRIVDEIVKAMRKCIHAAQACHLIISNRDNILERMGFFLQLMLVAYGEIDTESSSKLFWHLNGFHGTIGKCIVLMDECNLRPNLQKMKPFIPDGERFRVLDQSIVADSRRFIATLQSLNVSDSAKSTLERVSSKLDDSYIYLDSANVVIECILANGGLNTVVEYPSKLADLSAQLSLAPKQLESVLDKMRPYLQFRIDETAVMLDQSGPHALIKHPRLRLFWKRAIGVEAIDGVDFLNKIANYTKQTYDDPSVIAIMEGSRSRLQLCKVLSWETTRVLSAARLGYLVALMPNAPLDLGELIKALSSNPLTVYPMPQRNPFFIRRPDIVPAVCTALAAPSSIVWLYGRHGSGASSIAAEAASQLSTGTMALYSSTIFVSAHGVVGEDVPLRILNLISPSRYNTDVSGLVFWASHLMHRTLIVVDNVLDEDSEWGWLGRMAQFDKLSILITAYTPPGNSIASVVTESIKVPRLRDDQILQLLHDVVPSPTESQKEHITSVGLPGAVFDLAASIRLHLLFTKADPTQVQLQQMDAIRQLCVFENPFDEEAAVDILGDHVISGGVVPPSEAVRGVVLSLEQTGILQRTWNKLLWLPVHPPNVDVPLRSIERFCALTAFRMATCLSMFKVGHPAASVALMDSQNVLPHMLQLMGMPIPHSCLHLMQLILDVSGSNIMVRTSGLRVPQFFKRMESLLDPIGSANESPELTFLRVRIKASAGSGVLTSILDLIVKGDRDARLVEADVWYCDSMLLTRSGDYKQALDSALKTVGLRVELLGKRNIDTSMAFMNAATVYRHLKEYTKAFECCEQALSINLACVGETHPFTILSYTNYALTYYAQQDLPRTLQMADKVLVLRRSVYGEYHPETADIHGLLAHVYIDMGDDAKALQHVETTLTIYVAVRGESDPATGVAYTKIAGLRHRLGREDLALVNYEKAIGVLERTASSRGNALLAATVYNSMGTIYSTQHKNAQSLECHEKALAVLRSQVGDNYEYTAMALHNVAMELQALGRLQEAIDYMQQAHDAFDALHGPNHKDTEEAAVQLAKWNGSLR